MRTTDQLAELIRCKHQVLLQLRDLGQRQAELVAAGDTGSLLKLLAVKQRLIAAIQALERDLAPYYEEDPEQRSWPTADSRQRCAQQAAECNALLQEIVRLEKASAEAMTVRRNEVAEQLHQVHAAAHVRSAYEAQRHTRA
jgi:hypothetical protein